MIIYKATNKLDGKIYIGKTSQKLTNRIKRHLRSDYYFSRALRKHGLESFDFTVIEELDCNKTASCREQYWIKFYKSKGENGYNLTDGGEGITGWKHSKETRRKISQANEGQVFSDETRKKLSEAHLGVSLSIKHRKNIGLAHLGYKHSKESRRRMSFGQRGSTKKPLSDEAKKKISIARKGVLKSEETKNRMSMAKKGTKLPPRTDAHRKAMSIAVKKSWKRRKENGTYEVGCN